MNEPGIDAEKLAALIDGRLDERERAQLLARLASSEDAVEVYADAAAAIHELESENAKVLPLSSPARRAERWRLPAGRWLAAASDPGRRCSRGAAALDAPAAVRTRAGPVHGSLIRDPSGSGITLSDASPWSTVRGAGEPLTPDRAPLAGSQDRGTGARGVVGDTASARLAAEAAALLESIPAGAPAATMYRVIARRAGAPGDELEPLLEQARVAASELAGGELVQLGAWTQAARIAAARRDAEFFRARESLLVLEGRRDWRACPKPRVAQLQRVRSNLASGGPPDWSALERQLTDLLGVLGS